MPNHRPALARHTLLALGFAVHASSIGAQTQNQGPSSSRAPYCVPAGPAHVVRSITSLTTATDLIALTGGTAGATYEVGGMTDGMGAYDNGDGTITLLVNHEISNTAGVIRRHGAMGAYVEELIIQKTTLQVLSGQDLIQNIVDSSANVHSAANANGIALHRFCSGDLPAESAFFNATTGLGTQDRIFMNGEESSVTGYCLAHVATGVDKGTSHVLPGFSLSTNGSGLTGIGSYENLLACPHPQDKTIVIGNNDGGTGIMNNAVAVYIGQKQSVGTVVEKAGLKNGTLLFINVAGNAVEIANTTTRATNITGGLRFSLSGMSSTTFSRPEDGCWNPANPRQFFFVTTDRLDTVTSTGPNPTMGASGPVQSGMSRLWRLTFDDITNPLLGGTIDLLINGSKNEQKVQMFDNLAVTASGRIYINEDPGNSTYNGKVWCYDVATSTLVPLAKFDPYIWGELAILGGTPGALAPHTNDKETSGILDVSDLFPHSADESILLFSVMDHSSNAALATTASVQGGQLILMKVAMDAGVLAFGINCGQPGMSLLGNLGSQPRIGTTQTSSLARVPVLGLAFMSLGLSNTNLNGIPLPMSLSPFRLTGCFLYHDAAFGLAFSCTPTGPTTAQFLVSIPSSQIFVGMKLYLQAFAPDQLAGPAFIIGSNALQLTIGL
ncbi:MAG: hypothetical protein NT107_02435 [Planctomycetota bacterium]|nr:hypothetical protein [Planctomycetota bacterium]MSR40121.1 hypothetical protein [Planctomycetota bacterium]